MNKDDKINIKLEVFKDRNSGKLSILAHFDQNAPNIKKDSEGFIWIPTIEEKDLINEAFQLMPLDISFNQTKTSTHTIEDTKKIFQPPQTATKYKQEIYENNSDINKEQNIFEITKKEIKTEHIISDSPPSYENINQRPFEKKHKDQELNDKYAEEKIIVEADSDAIEKALQKHGDKDDSIVEVDEQTIIDRVLSQKKKGKWSKR